MRAVLPVVCLVALLAGPAAASRELRVAPAYPPPENITALSLTPSAVAYYTATNGAGTRYAACRESGRKCDTGLQCCGYLGSQLWTAEPGKKLDSTCVVNRPYECLRTVVGAAGAPCGKRNACEAGLTCCYTVPFLGGFTDEDEVPTCQNATTPEGCPRKAARWPKDDRKDGRESRRGLLGTYPAPDTITALSLTPSARDYYTATYGAGTRYAACNTDGGRACAVGLQCCGYLGSQAWTAEPNVKLDDTCVVRGPTECPRTVVGAEGGPCGRRRSCQAGLICCDSVLYLGGLTEEKMPTCQSPTLPGACPSRKRQEGPKSTVTASTQQTVAVVATAGLPRQQADAAGAGDGEVGGSWPES